MTIESALDVAGQQTVRVEHVTVQAGGQAIVGRCSCHRACGIDRWKDGDYAADSRETSLRSGGRSHHRRPIQRCGGTRHALVPDAQRLGRHCRESRNQQRPMPRFRDNS
jgi:hypothetical protein